MKLKNKKTGKIVEWFNNTNGVFPDSLAELNEEWEDVEKPKEYWAIDCFSPDGLISEFTGSSSDILENRKSIGNYFDTPEEAEKAVEKLKAWKRLRDEGIKLGGWTREGDAIYPELIDTGGDVSIDDLELLFGGEE